MQTQKEFVKIFEIKNVIDGRKRCLGRNMPLCLSI